MVKRSRHDISDNEGSEDEALLPLPPPHSPGQDGGDLMLNEDEGEVSKLADVPVAKRKVVKRPQPKLDSQRLISDRGLPFLRTMFDDVHFKGKGHEAADLRLLMQKMENWAHRLYPKLQFEDFIDKVEKLGAKKEVQTCLKRIRLDMPLTHDDFIGEDAAEPEPRVFEDADPFSDVSFVNEAPRPIFSTPASAAPPTPSPVVPSLTEEQRRRMELNRQRALEKRMSRGQQQLTDSQNSGVPSTAEEPTPSSENVLTESNDQTLWQEELDSVPKPTSTSLHIDSEHSDEARLHQEEEEEKQESVTQSAFEGHLEKTEPSAELIQLKEEEEKPEEQESPVQTPHPDDEASSESTQNKKDNDEETTLS